MWWAADNSSTGGHMQVLTWRVMYSETGGESDQWHAKGQQGARPLQVWPPVSAVPRQTSFHTPFSVFLSLSTLQNDQTGLKLYAIYSPSFSLTGPARCRAMIGKTKRGYGDKCNSSGPSSPLILLWLLRQSSVMDGVVEVDRSNVRRLLHGDLLFREWERRAGWGVVGWRDSHRDPRISTVAVSGKLDYNSQTMGWVRRGRQEV